MSTTADDFIEMYLSNYNNTYDDQDRYGDFIYDLYDSVNQSVDERSLLILDHNKFNDFFDFCMEHINNDVVDNDIQTRGINHLQREIGHRKAEIVDNDENLTPI